MIGILCKTYSFSTAAYAVRRLGILVLTATTLSMSVAWAEEPSFELDIPAQDLNSALKSLAVETDRQVLFSAAVVNGHKSPAINGEYSTTEAMDILLADSALTYDVTESNVLLVKAADADERGASDSKNLSPTPVLMAQNQTSQSTTSSTQSSEGGTSIVTGKVTDARTGANLKGAQVTIEETGQWTSTDDLGEFRIANVPMGRATLAVSYLGYAGQSTVVSVRGDSVSQSFALSGSGEFEEIVVFGQRSARAISLNRERTADNVSSVLSADLLGNFGGSTISDALRRAPGIAFEPDLETGDGAKVIVRGLGPDLNQVLINGIRVPDGTGIGRSPDLGGVLTESVESVTVSKTLLPNQDTNGAGGLVEIETKSPLDRPRRFANVGVELTDRGGEFGEDMQATATIAGTFGSDEDLGVSASLQFREQDVRQLSYRTTLQIGQYLPNGISAEAQIDPRTQFPFEPGVNLAYPSFVGNSSDEYQRENLSLTLSAEKQFAEHTNIRIDHTQSALSGSSLRREQSSAALINGYVLQPIDELGGEERYAWITEGAGAAFGLSGLYLSDGQIVVYTPAFDRDTGVSSLRGETVIGNWRFKYGAGYAEGSNRTPEQVTMTIGQSFASVLTPADPNELLPIARDNTINGNIVSPFVPVPPNFDPGFITPAYSQQRLDRLANLDSYVMNIPGNLSGSAGSNSRETYNASAQYEFDSGILQYVEAGILYESAEFKTKSLRETIQFSSGSSGRLGDYGLELGPGLFNEAGISTSGFDVLTASSIDTFASNIALLGNAGLLATTNIPINETNGKTGTTEDETASYIQGKFNFGRVQVIGGARLSHVSFGSDFLSRPSLTLADGTRVPDFASQFGQLVTSQASFTDLLPRVTLNYRHSDEMILRFGFYTSIARPRIQQLSTTTTPSLDLRPDYGDQNDQPRLLLRRGNPELEPAYTDNFDLSFEYYSEKIGVFKIGGFYKEIRNLFETVRTEGGQDLLPEQLSLPDAPEFNDLPGNLLVSVSQPINDENKARIWGVETAFEHQFIGLPGAWNGLGTYANYTYTDSSRVQRVPSTFAENGSFFEIDDAPFSGSPKRSGTIAVTYNKYGFDGILAYTFQDRRLSLFDSFGLTKYDDEIDSLDIRIEYLIDASAGKYKLYFEGSDIMKGNNEPSITGSIGEGQLRYEGVRGRYFGGRSFVFGVAATF